MIIIPVVCACVIAGAIYFGLSNQNINDNVSATNATNLTKNVTAKTSTTDKNNSVSNYVRYAYFDEKLNLWFDSEGYTSEDGQLPRGTSYKEAVRQTTGSRD